MRFPVLPPASWLPGVTISWRTSALSPIPVISLPSTGVQSRGGNGAGKGFLLTQPSPPLTPAYLHPTLNSQEQI